MVGLLRCKPDAHVLGPCRIRRRTTKSPPAFQVSPEGFPATYQVKSKRVQCQPMSAKGHWQTYAAQKGMSVLGQKRASHTHKQKDRLAAVSPKLNLVLNHAASAAAFFFLRQPSRPNAPRPVAKSGSVAGSGVVAASDPKI